jgi:hypothetical protein
VRILCEYLTAVGFLTKNGGDFGLTPESVAFLDRRSPGYLGGTTEFLLSEAMSGAFRDVAAAVRKGGVATDIGRIMEMNHPVWVKYAQSMTPVMAPAVLDVAKGHAAEAGMASRYHTIGGNAIDAELGQYYDAVLLTNFLHLFNEEACVQLLRKIHAALKPAGRAVTLDYIPNDDRVSPAVPAMPATAHRRPSPRRGPGRSHRRNRA